MYIVAMIKSERVGYGYERPDRDFKAHNCDLVVIDTKASKRVGRLDVMHRIRKGDVLVIYSWKELAPGALKAHMVDLLNTVGVTVELLDIPAKPPVKPSRRGLSDEAKSEALTMWHEPTKFSVEYIQNHLARKGHGNYSRNQLNYALGPPSGGHE